MPDPASPKDQCHEDLRARILKLDLRPGAALEEAPLCAAYALSRTPLREVLQRLAGEGFVRLWAGRGAEVMPIDLSRLRQFFQSAPLLHALVARLAAQEAGAEEIAGLRAAQLGVVRARVARNAASMALADFRFHAALCRIGGNPYFGPSLERLLMDQCRMSQRFWSGSDRVASARIDAALAEHEALINAIEARDAARAVSLALTHWEAARAHIEAHVQPPPLSDEAGLFDDPA